VVKPVFVGLLLSANLLLATDVAYAVGEMPIANAGALAPVIRDKIRDEYCNAGNGWKCAAVKVTCLKSMPLTPADHLNGIMERKLGEIKFALFSGSSWDEVTFDPTFTRTPGGWSMTGGMENNGDYCR